MEDKLTSNPSLSFARVRDPNMAICILDLGIP
jgi:hypothetical protein